MDKKMNIKIVKQIMELEAYVESETTDGVYYLVTCINDEWECTCQSFKNRKQICKHIREVKEEI